MSSKTIASPAVVGRQSLGSLKVEPLTCWIGAELKGRRSGGRRAR